MSEEEIIGIVNEFDIDTPLDYNHNDVRKVLRQAIQGLLDLYNKEKERNMNLELENIGLKENRRIAVEEIQEEYYISKDKIREKIKKLDKAYEDSKDEDGVSPYYYPDYTIDILNELLEEE